MTFYEYNKQYLLELLKHEKVERKDIIPVIKHKYYRAAVQLAAASVFANEQARIYDYTNDEDVVDHFVEMFCFVEKYQDKFN